MSKSDFTIFELEAALTRIISGDPQRVSKGRKLSVRAVEDEADLGDGSAYYYKDFIKKIKTVISDKKNKTNVPSTDTEIFKLKQRLKKETHLKDTYREEVIEKNKQLAAMAAIHNQLTLQTQIYQEKIVELTSDNTVHLPKNDIPKE